jgi:hypothetical protein
MLVIVKGNRHHAQVAASNRAIPFAIVSVTDHETVGRVPEACHAKVGAWFCEPGEAPFPVGTCLLYRSEEAAA